MALLRSEVGVLYLNKDNETVLRKVIREHDLQFTPLFTAKPHVFVSASSRWRPSPPSRWTTWPHTRAFPMSRASTTPFIFPKKF